MNYKSLFYWMTVADNAKILFIVFMSIFTLVSAVATCCFFFGREGDDMSCPKDGLAERSKRWMWWSYPFMIFFWMLFVLTPSKKDALLIVAGGETMNYLTSDSTAKQIPHEMLSFVTTELRSMAADAKVELGILNQKDKVLEEAKTMTTDQLLNKMKLDSNFTKIVLDK